MNVLRFDQQALADIADINAYISQFDVDAASRVVEHIVARIELLKRQPDIGKRTAKASLRVMYPTKYPYRVYFMHSGVEIIVLHIRHTSRAVPDLDKLL